MQHCQGAAEQVTNTPGMVFTIARGCQTFYWAGGGGKAQPTVRTPTPKVA